jgi:hypothetical protein
MPQLTEDAAERFSPEQATALVRVLELQAGWDGLLVAREDGLAGLQARQKAHDAFQASLREYTSRYPSASVPEPTLGRSVQLALWCRALRAVFRRATVGGVELVMAKVYRLADRIAAREKREPVGRWSQPVGMAGAIDQLDAVIAWCVGPAGDRCSAYPASR